MSQLYRLHYRGQLNRDYSQQELEGIVAECRKRIREAQERREVLTAALYQYHKMLFFYYEAVGNPLETIEPIREPRLAGEGVAAEGMAVNAALREYGEDIQATVRRPEELLFPFAPYLQSWPGQRGDRLWVHMYHIYYHSMPKSPEDWQRAGDVAHRRGRIAFLRWDKLFSYVYYHKALVDEGLLVGDRYQSIALHENILFSYFEEPRTETNIREENRPSAVIEEWLAADPESHFIHMPEGKGENFTLLPSLFAIGQEERSIPGDL